MQLHLSILLASVFLEVRGRRVVLQEYGRNSYLSAGLEYPEPRHLPRALILKREVLKYKQIVKELTA